MNSCSNHQSRSNDTSTESPTIPEAVSGAQTNIEHCDPDCFGSQIGQTVPPYELTLSSNTTLTSEDLIYAKKPVFLFFFAKW
jgi:hypothetical protein